MRQTSRFRWFSIDNLYVRLTAKRFEPGDEFFVHHFRKQLLLNLRLHAFYGLAFASIDGFQIKKLQPRIRIQNFRGVTRLQPLDGGLNAGERGFPFRILQDLRRHRPWDSG